MRVKAQGKENPFRRVSRFLQEVWAELRKVLWPSQSEVLNHSTVVLGVIFGVAAFMWCMDLVFKLLMTRVMGLYK